mmetsp:Transcript_113259/g.283675  ORF Transcript_113259/g.283675 Transcript_113259/m.283675 type:complete len:592 (-) Transcript_113259:83-1858(-)
MGFKWSEVGTSFNVLWLYKYMAGGLPPPDEADVKGRSFAEITDVSVRRVHDANGGLGIPYSFLMWHWGMVLAFLLSFSAMFSLTTPIDSEEFPWLTLVQKLVIYWHLWESLGLGVIHGPLHAKMAPPFTDWWYRWTPGTLKYNAPFMPCLSSTRNVVDVLVEGVLSYLFAARCLCAAEVTPDLVRPLYACQFYEFVFDYGQHMHCYGTQNLHMLISMCFEVGQGQVVGIQLFLTWFYVCSGWCKIGPWFKYLNVSNLMCAKYMVGTPWAQWYRRLMFRAHDAPSPDYHLTLAASVISGIMAILEVLGPLLCLSTNFYVVWLGITLLICMHFYIISTLVIDVFVWNFADAIWYTVLFGILRTGFDWDALPSMHPAMMFMLSLHVAYSAYGHFVPSHVPYVVAHRHAAGNFSQGVLLIKKEAAGKLGALKAHAGLPKPQPGWQGEWFGFYALWAYLWNWNLPNKMLLPLVIDTLGGRSHEDFVIMHSVLFYDALIAHVRFDGLSSLKLTKELGRVCGFEEGECTLAWVGAFQSFPVWLFTSPTARWKVLDSKSGLVKEGIYDVKSLEDPKYCKPSDCVPLLLKLQEDGYKPCP